MIPTEQYLQDTEFHGLSTALCCKLDLLNLYFSTQMIVISIEIKLL